MLKVIRLTKDWYQVTIDGSTYVGNLESVKQHFSSTGHSFEKEADVVPLAGIEGIEYENKLPSELSKVCIFHDWKTYEGIYRKFQYCTICDIKDES